MGVSMRRHILSRANVVALKRGGNLISQSPFAQRGLGQFAAGPLGAEHDIRVGWPELWEAQSRQ